MIVKKLFFGACRLIEVLINLVVFVYGPYVVYRHIDVGEYVTGGLLVVTICLIGVVDYSDARIKKTVVGRFLHRSAFWESIKHEVSNKRRSAESGTTKTLNNSKEEI